MLSGGQFVELLLDRFEQENVRFEYRFPVTYLIICNSSFSGDDEEDESCLADALSLSVAELRGLANRLYLRFDCTPEHTRLTEQPRQRGYSWSRLLWDAALDIEEPPVEPQQRSRVIHFYGYKGGQARSTVLGFLGIRLAEDGWRVLAIDADAEAPTLDVLLDGRASEPSGTLVGIDAGLTPRPFRVRSATSGGGWLDLIAFRPRDTRFDIDAASLAMRMALSPPFAEPLIEKVAAAAADYDIVLVDHRTGLAATVPPWVRRLPGPVVAFSRMDRQWEGATTFIERLWALHPRRPGALVSFKADESSPFGYMKQAQSQAMVLLDQLANVINAGAEPNQEPVTAEDVTDHWIIWPLDPAFGRGALPSGSAVSRDCLDAISGLRRLLGLLRPPPREALPQVRPGQLHPSGALDDGHLIVTQALRELDTENASKWFILGRKGTGKSRLMRELAHRSKGEPLLAAEPGPSALGLPARHPAVGQLWKACRKEPQRFWWALLWAGVISGTGEQQLAAAIEGSIPDDPMYAVIHRARDMVTRRVFFVDGLETAFPRGDTFDAIGALFRVWSTLDADSRLATKLRLRVFIRTDLAERGYENVEQLLHDRSLELRWDTQAILNFALSRIHQREWYRSHFADVCSDIGDRLEIIREGQLETAECEGLMLRIFPERLRRLNMLTTTFLRTWFSDDPGGAFGFYPRIYDTFLAAITESPGPEPLIVDGRINQDTIFGAHEKATEDFLQQVRVELINLVDLTPDLVDRLLNAFHGRVTPFSIAQEIEELAGKTGLKPAEVRQTLEQMRTLGIFELHPRVASQWRAGRLFKTSLGMLYNRRRKERS